VFSSPFPISLSRVRMWDLSVCLCSCLIPGNLLAEGALTVSVSGNAILGGKVAHGMERDAIRFYRRLFG
jgi:hypothetical protein